MKKKILKDFWEKNKDGRLYTTIYPVQVIIIFIYVFSWKEKLSLSLFVNDLFLTSQNVYNIDVQDKHNTIK